LIVNIVNEQRDLPLSRESVKKLVFCLLNYLRISCEEFSVYFVTNRRIAKLHEEFFDDPTPTDTISFPLDPLKKKQCAHLGEVFVCPKVALEYSRKNNLDPYEETSLYLVHGILHILGFCDLTPAKKRNMRQKEKECLRILKQNNALLYRRRKITGY
jgi:probable rRNA maturation factor